MSSQSEGKHNVKVATVSGLFDLHQLAKKEKEALIQLSENPNMKIPTSFFSGEKEISTQINNTRKAAESGAKIIIWSDTEYGRLSNVICYDYDFPSLSMLANKKDVNIMLVPAYDWQGFAPMHSKMAQFETLQNGRLLIRSNGNGKSIITDNQGAAIAKQNTFSSKEKVLYATLPLNTSPTVYSKIGNSFVILCFVCLFLSIIGKIISRFKHSKKGY